MPTDSPALAPDHRGPFQIQVPDHDRMPGRAPKRSCRANPYLKSSDACAEEQKHPSRHPHHDLTGRFQDDQGRFNLFINHVGAHIECLVALATNGRHPKVRPGAGGGIIDERESRCARLFGDAPSHLAGRFTLDARDPAGNPRFPEGAGQLDAVDYSTLMLFLDHPGLPAWLRELSGAVCTRVDDRPSLFEGHLGVAAVPELPALLRTIHWFPLTDIQVEFLERLILTHRAELRTDEPTRMATLEEMIEESFAVRERLQGEEQRHARQRVAESIDGLVAEVFSLAQTTPVTEGGIHEAQQDFHRAIVQRVLTRTFLTRVEATGPVEHSLLHRLAKIVERTPNELRLRAIPEHLGLRSVYGVEYSARLDLHAVEGGLSGVARELSKYLRAIPVSAGVYKGTLTITAKGPRGWGPVVYDMVIGFVGAGVGKGIPSRIIGTGHTPPTSTRDPEDLAGPCFMTEASAGISVGGGRSRGGAVLTLVGKGSGRSLGFDCSGVSALEGLTAGASINMHAGMVKLRDDPDRVGDIGPTWEMPKVEHTREIEQLHQNHFSINNALLMPEAMAMLDEVAATELVVLSDPKTDVTIHGYADRSGREDFNQDLSMFRAENAKEFILSSSKRIKASIVAEGQGEQGPTDKGAEDNVLYRRVDIRIDKEIKIGMDGIH